MSNTLHGEDLPLAKVLKPDFSEAVEIAVGVRVFRVKMSPPCHFFFLLFFALPLIVTLNPNPDPNLCIWSTFSWGHQKAV